jgi:hypothetical protein
MPEAPIRPLGPGRSGEPSIPVIHKTPGLAPCQVFASALAAPFTVKALLFGAADAQGLQLRGSPAERQQQGVQAKLQFD